MTGNGMQLLNASLLRDEFPSVRSPIFVFKLRKATMCLFSFQLLPWNCLREHELGSENVL